MQGLSLLATWQPVLYYIVCVCFAVCCAVCARPTLWVRVLLQPRLSNTQFTADCNKAITNNTATAILLLMHLSTQLQHIDGVPAGKAYHCFPRSI